MARIRHGRWPCDSWSQSLKSELCGAGPGCENRPVSSTGRNDYCAFSKAIEHLGDRWSLPILAQLVVLGPLGFNEFANGLPGRISRSILAEKLRKLEDLGLISRDDGGPRPRRYRLTGIGRDLAPTILALRGWAETWLPDDVAMVERDPEVVLGWLTKCIDVTALPERQAVVEITIRNDREDRFWLVLERGIEPFGCFEDPMLDESRYVYVEAGITVLVALAGGRRSWTDAFADESIRAFGMPDLTIQVPTWFRRVDQRDAERLPGAHSPVSAVARSESGTAASTQSTP
jgi:DNA-binding HxlR family transcriptional regulator